MLCIFVRRPLESLFNVRNKAISKSFEFIGTIVIQPKKKGLNFFSSYINSDRLNNMATSSTEITYCPFSTKAKKLFGEVLKVPYHVLELDHDPQGPAIQDCLGQLTGQKTIPNVFVNGQHIGGYDATSSAYQQGRLQPLLWTTTATMTAVKGNVAEAPSQSPSQPPPSETLTSDTLREPVLQRETTTSTKSITCLRL
jgi:glutaredoxin 3